MSTIDVSFLLLFRFHSHCRASQVKHGSGGFGRFTVAVDGRLADGNDLWLVGRRLLGDLVYKGEVGALASQGAVGHRVRHGARTASS